MTAEIQVDLPNQARFIEEQLPGRPHVATAGEDVMAGNSKDQPSVGIANEIILRSGTTLKVRRVARLTFAGFVGGIFEQGRGQLIDLWSVQLGRRQRSIIEISPDLLGLKCVQASDRDVFDFDEPTPFRDRFAGDNRAKFVCVNAFVIIAVELKKGVVAQLERGVLDEVIDHIAGRPIVRTGVSEAIIGNPQAPVHNRIRWGSPVMLLDKHHGHVV